MARRADNGAAYGRNLERSAPFFAMLGIIIFAAFAFYRIRTRFLLDAISPGFTLGDGMLSYILEAFASDTTALALAVAVLAALWLLGALIGRWAAPISLLWAAACSVFLVAASDFIRVYQAPFSRNYVGGEHFTGIRSMIVSVAAELSFPSLIAITVLVAAIAAIIMLSAYFRRRIKDRTGPVMGAQKAFSVIAAFSLAVFIAMNVQAVQSGGDSGSPPGNESGAERTLARELAVNPLSALAFGPHREAYAPPVAVEAEPARHGTDSLEFPGIYRPLPRVAKGRRNVILYFFESMSWSYYDLERNGEYAAPRMRALAEGGLLLDEHYSNYPLSANTLYSVLSSRYSAFGKSMFFGEYHDVDARTLPEVLSEAGYAVCFVHTGDLLYAARDKFLANRGIATFMLEKDLMKDGRFSKKVGWGADERSMIEPAIEWIEAQEGPYLLMMSPVSPHHPYAIPKGFPEFVDPEEDGIGEAERNFRAYLNSLHYADSAMGDFVAELETRGLMEGTVFIMVTDHGEAFYQHKGNYNHPLLVYEENVHVPALFYGPSVVPAQAPLGSVTRHIDIMPSILDLLGVKDSGLRDGESVFSASKEKMAVFHTSWADELIGVRDGKWKYIKRVKDSREELYDLISDPRERTGLSADFPAITERYRAVADDMAAYMIEQYADIERK